MLKSAMIYLLACYFFAGYVAAFLFIARGVAMALSSSPKVRVFSLRQGLIAAFSIFLWPLTTWMYLASKFQRTATSEGVMFPAGFTGFLGESDSAPAVDRSLFKTVCHAAARELRGVVVEFVFADVTPNYHRATLQWAHGAKTVSILCNRQFWIVGFRTPADAVTQEYVDCPELAEVLQNFSSWQILSRATLNAYLDDVAIQAMAPQDRQAVEKARAKGWITPAWSVGDVLFNGWD
jgi:hypothetical protein